jgi:protein-S-isoprenylcysteine O-methyltransferase Ste14
MNSTKNPDDTGMFIPPVVFYIITFIIGILMQRIIPFRNSLFEYAMAKIFGVLMVIIALVFLFISVRQFIIDKTTFEVNKPVAVLQTRGVYNLTRNPMYVGLLFLYLGMTFLIGNFWQLILLPLLFFFIQEYVIKREEKYLERKFGQQYISYKLKVRRWL